MKQYFDPKFDIFHFNLEDVILASGVTSTTTQKHYDEDDPENPNTKNWSIWV